MRNYTVNLPVNRNQSYRLEYHKRGEFIIALCNFFNIRISHRIISKFITDEIIHVSRNRLKYNNILFASNIRLL